MRRLSKVLVPILILISSIIVAVPVQADDPISTVPINSPIKYKGQFCASFGAYCAATPNMNNNTVIVGGLIGQSRTLKWEPGSGSVCYNGTCYTKGVLAFPNWAPSACAAAGGVNPTTNTIYAIVYNCTGVNGIEWGIGYDSNNHLIFINDYYTRHDNALMVLSTTTDGHYFTVQKWQATGYLQKFDFH